VVGHLEVTPLAFESLGTRSMATLVKAKKLKILLDPGVALAPRRYGLPPHPVELSRMREHWERIRAEASSSQVLVVTHYHYDHHNPREPEVYRGKTVFVKHPKRKINFSQRKRAALFLKEIGPLVGELDYSDGKEFSVDDVTIRFSEPVLHGTSERLGYVTEVSISHKDFTLVFTSDVEGPSISEQAEFIIDEDPSLVICDGPMTYMLGYRYGYESLEKTVENVTKIFSETRVKDFIFEHHLLRDLEWSEKLAELLRRAEELGVTVQTAAEYMGVENDFLEANRRKLWGQVRA